MRRVLGVVGVVVLSLAAAVPAWAGGPPVSHFQALPDAMTSPREWAGAAPLPSGKVLIAGGFSGIVPLASSEIFDPELGTFTGSGSLASARTSPALVALRDGRVLELGGIEAPQGASIFTEAGGAFTPLVNTLTSGRVAPAAALLPNGKVLIAGGSGSDAAEIYDPADDSFTYLAASLPGARGFAGAVTLGDGRVLIVGGSDGVSALDTAVVFDPVTATFSTLPAHLSAARSAPAVALLPSGKVLVAGGSADAGGGGPFLDTAEIFDPADNAFHALGDTIKLTTPRYSPAAAALPDGTVLIAGGANTGGYLGSAELFVSAPEAQVTGAAFATRPPGDTSPAQTVTVRNVGAMDLGIGSGPLTVAGPNAADFAIQSQSCTGALLFVRQTCTVEVRFTPGAPGARQASIALDTNEPGSSSVALTGAGTAPAPPPVVPPVVVPPVPKATRTTTCRARAATVRGRRVTRITCTVKVQRPRAAAVRLTTARGVTVARGRITKAGRVTLTVARRPRVGSYRLRIGKTKVTVRLA